MTFKEKYINYVTFNLWRITCNNPTVMKNSDKGMLVGPGW